MTPRNTGLRAIVFAAALVACSDSSSDTTLQSSSGPSTVETTSTTNGSTASDFRAIAPGDQQILQIDWIGEEDQGVPSFDYLDAVVFESSSSIVVSVNHYSGTTLVLSEGRTIGMRGSAIGSDRVVRYFGGSDSDEGGPPLGFEIVGLDGKVLQRTVLDESDEGDFWESPIGVLDDGTFLVSFDATGANGSDDNVTMVFSPDGSELTVIPTWRGEPMGAAAALRERDDRRIEVVYLAPGANADVGLCSPWDSKTRTHCTFAGNPSKDVTVVDYRAGVRFTLPLPCAGWGGSWHLPELTPDGGLVVWPGNPSDCEGTADTSTFAIGYDPDGIERWRSANLPHSTRTVGSRLLGVEGSKLTEFDQSTGKPIDSIEIKDSVAVPVWSTVAAGNEWVLLYDKETQHLVIVGF